MHPDGRTCSSTAASRTSLKVAEGVLWLVSDRARLVTGHALPVDAGWIVKRGG
jgi:NAD(P)-dependent dehydrogenase (short-subunit alcohol dehydrogenase family)